MPDKPSRLGATTLSEETCRRLIQTFSTGRQPGGTGRFAQLHAECLVRDAHYHNSPSAAPKFDEPFDKSQTYQSDVLRETYSKGRSRMLEHDPIIRVTPKRDIQTQRDAANALERYFQEGLRTVEERLGFRLQGHMFHGQAVHAYGVLHWRDYAADWPEMPDLDETDSPEVRENYRDRSKDDDYESGPKYRERESARMDRFKRSKAEAPFPWWFDVPRTDVCWFAEDKSLLNGMALFGTVESVGYMDYAFALQDKDGLEISINQDDKRVLIFEEQDRPEGYDPSGNDSQFWGALRVARVWTRNECYELVSHSDGGTWTLAKSWKHDYGMPSFVLAKAGENNHPDPLYRWYPWMLGLFRTKGQYDYERSLGRLLAEQTVIKKCWIELAPGTFWLNDDGTRRVFSESAALAETLPAGAQIKYLEITVDPAFVAFLSMSKEDVAAAKPETGFVESSATTQPHTLVIQQSQANEGIAELKTEQARAFRIAFQSILDTMKRRAEDGDPVCVMGDNGQVLEIEADVLGQLTVEVTIEPNSGAQQVARNEYLRGLLADPKAMMTVRKYLEETGDPDPDVAIQSWMAEQGEMGVMPQVIQQELAREYGDQYVITPGGTAVGMDGTPADPWTVLISAGFQKPPQGAPQAPGVSPANAPLGELGPGAPLAPPNGNAGVVV